MHPSPKVVTAAPPLPVETVEIAGEGVVLKGWLFRATGERRGTIVYLHVYQALGGPKRLLLLPKTGHGVGLDEATWKIIDAWVTGQD